MVAATKSECTVLLVEDVEADAYLTKMAFDESKMKANIVHVLNGMEAVSYLTGQPPWQNAPRPDLILLDLNMPQMDGREFLAWIKAQDELSAIPIIVLTTSTVQRDVLLSYKTGAAGYIVKPVDIQQLIEAIRSLEEYWFVLVRLPNGGGEG